MAKKKKRPRDRGLAALGAEARKARARQVERAEELLALIERRKAQIADAFYDVGEALRELLRDKLHVALGHASFEEMLVKRRVLAHTRAKQLIRIVDRMPRHLALELGPSKSLELVRWTEATPDVDTPASVIRKNTSIDGVPARNISARGLSDARTTLVAGQRRAKGEVDAKEEAAGRTARTLQAWLRKHGARAATATPRRTASGWRVAAELTVAEADELSRVR